MADIMRASAGVAPRAGARIETLSAPMLAADGMRRSPRGSADRNNCASAAILATVTSLPARERGSKPQRLSRARRSTPVAPRAGARIETTQFVRASSDSRVVAPRAGARIETPSGQCSAASALGSLPARERGSKPPASAGQRMPSPSLPARERGSKHASGLRQPHGDRVAPRAGARIETACAGRDVRRLSDVAPRAGARIETCHPATSRRVVVGRSPRGSADRNQPSNSPPPATRAVAPRAGARIETRHPARPVPAAAVAPRAGARIETASSTSVVAIADWSLPARERGSKR